MSNDQQNGTPASSNTTNKTLNSTASSFGEQGMANNSIPNHTDNSLHANTEGGANINGSINQSGGVSVYGGHVEKIEYYPPPISSLSTQPEPVLPISWSQRILRFQGHYLFIVGAFIIVLIIIGFFLLRPSIFAFITASPTMLIKGIEIEKNEVTVGQYHTCVDFGGCHPSATLAEKPQMKNATQNNDPLEGMDAFEARDYCYWLGRRLPRDAELQEIFDTHLLPSDPPSTNIIYDWTRSQSKNQGDWTGQVNEQLMLRSQYGVGNAARYEMTASTSLPNFRVRVRCIK